MLKALPLLGPDNSRPAANAIFVHHARTKCRGWSVGWIDPEGRRKSKRIGLKSAAEKFRRRTEGELAAGTYESENRKKWADFRQQYEQEILPLLKVKTWQSVRSALNKFEEHCRPIKVAAITTKTMDEFIAGRRLDPGRKVGSRVSPATINHDLRHIKAALNIAKDWGYLPKMPKFRKVKEPDRIGAVITPEHFQAVYEACDVATMPEGLHCPPEDWWRALCVLGITSGWRIEEILSLRREDIDLATGKILTRCEDNKGGRDDIDHLPQMTVDHIKAVVLCQS